MNTVEAGNNFENRSYELIEKAILDDRLGISPKYAKLFKKKRYSSILRDNGIVVDLSIEIWPPAATRYSLLYIIECKNYCSKDVPVDDIEEFLNKLQQIAGMGFFVKGVFITNSSFQSGTLEVGKKAGLMMIEVQDDAHISIVLHKGERNTIQYDDQIISSIKEVESFLYATFDLTRVQGLKRLSKKEISVITENILNELDPGILEKAKELEIEDLLQKLRSDYDLVFDLESTLSAVRGKAVYGSFDIRSNTISIDKNIVNTDRFLFLLAHEIGHFFLHRELKINQDVYDHFQDSEYDFLTDKYLLNNHRNWIEWQANHFAASLIMPKKPFIARLTYCQEQLGISKKGHIFLDDQPVNKQDFMAITNYLLDFYHTTRTSVIYRIEDLELITYARSLNNFRNELRDIAFSSMR